jgi:type II secretory ATPase GspE/PulE/Tfp pilus assembly ATPase PilB-like protein
MEVNDDLRDAVQNQAPALTLKKIAQESGMVTLRQDGFAKVSQGVTTVEEVLRVTQDAG